MAEISVVVTAHNPGTLLRAALDSVLAQTFEDFECIVVDDASSPPVETLVEVDDPRVRILRLDTNVGVAAARNIAVGHARTPWVAFLDHDDTWSPDKLRLQHEELLRSPEAWLSYTGFEWVFPDGTRRSAPGHEVTYEGLLADEMINLSSVIVSRAAYQRVGGCNPMLVWAQDHDLLLKLLLFGPAPAWVPDCVTQYRLHGANHSSNFLGSVSFRRLVIDQHELRAVVVGDDRVQAAARRGRARADELLMAQSFDAARAARRRGAHGEMVRHLGRMVRVRASRLTRGLKVARRPSLRRATQHPQHRRADPGGPTG